MGDHYLKSAFLENVRTIVGEPERSHHTRIARPYIDPRPQSRHT